MVSDTKQYVGKMFDTMTEGLHTAVETGRRTNETMFKTMNEFCRVPAGFEDMGGHFAVRAMNEIAPVMQKNMDTAFEATETGVRAGVDFMRTAMDMTRDMNPENVQDKTRQMWDASFNMMRTGMDLFGKAGTMAMDNFTQMCRGMAGGFEKSCKPTQTPAPKAGK
jgi:hypothetical protein